LKPFLLPVASGTISIVLIISHAKANDPVPVSSASTPTPAKMLSAEHACPTTNYSLDAEVPGSGVIAFDCDKDAFPFALATYLHEHKKLGVSAIAPTASYSPTQHSAFVDSFLVVFEPRP